MHAADWPNDAVNYALCSKDGAILREGRGTLTELAKDIFKSKVTVLIAASDVTLLEISIPTMPEAKLRQALPNLVEDHLMSDSSENVLLLVAKQANGDANKRVVAVAGRDWLQQISTSLYALGATYVKALPAQLCLPYKNAHYVAQLEQFAQNPSTHCSLRSGVDSGAGVLLESGQGVDHYLSTISLLSPTGPIVLQLPAELMDEYGSAIRSNPAWSDRMTIEETNWSSTIAESTKVSVNLMAGLNSAQRSRIKWKIWRWPLVLGGVTLLINVIGLNGEYWGLKREAQALKTGMAQTYKASFPKDAVSPFPLEQMKKNLEIAQRNSGQAASYDFTVLLTGFGSAWRSINADKLPKIASIEYKERALVVQVKGSMPQEELRKALLAKNLSLKKVNAEVWQIKDTAGDTAGGAK